MGDAGGRSRVEPEREGGRVGGREGGRRRVVVADM
jgi:hypothetical protein